MMLTVNDYDRYIKYFVFNTFIYIFNTLLFMYVGIYDKVINKITRLIAPTLIAS